MSFRRLLLAGIASVLFVTVVTGTVAIVALLAIVPMRFKER